jgi:tetratricopeptide (TPR) repeat protein
LIATQKFNSKIKKVLMILIDNKNELLKQKREKNIIKFSKEIELYPNRNLAYYYRGNCYYNLKKYEEAIIDYSKFIKLEPNQNRAYYYRAICYRKLKKYKESIIDCNKALELNFNKKLVYKVRCQCYYGLKKYEESIVDCLKFIGKKSDFKAKKSDDALVYNILGFCYASLKKYEEAVIYLGKTLELNFTDFEHILTSTSRTIYYEWKQYEEDLSDFSLLTSLPEYKNNILSVSLFAKTIYLKFKKYDLATKYIEKAFENCSSIEKIHKQAHLDDIRNREELDERNKELELKNKELELKNKELELQKKETEDAYQRVHDKEKEMLSFFTHTMRNALATAPSSLREAIRLLSCDDYETNKKHYNAINKIVTLFSTLSITDCLIDTFKQSISNQKEFTESWEKDCDGEATPKWVIALALRQSLNRIIFSDADKLIMLLDAEEITVVKSTRKSFIDNVLSLDIDAQSVSKLYIWIDATMNLIEVNTENENSMPNFGSHQVKFSLLFAITSELILNALKYWNGVGKIQIDWKCNEEHYIFTVKNRCEAHAISNLAGSKSGVKFITRLMDLLGEQARFNCTHEEQCFVAELALHKTLFEKLSKHESVMD